MAMEHFLVTGGLGRIGSWVVRRLIREGVATTIFDCHTRTERLELIMSQDEIAQVQFIKGDITNLPLVERALRETKATHVIHLASVPIPTCDVDPPLGAYVNVVGTVNVFEAVRRVGLQRIVYASNVAAYGAMDDYPERQVPHDAPLYPHTHYGVYKQANEGTAHIYWLKNEIASIGLRPYVVYGPGCDENDIISEPTRAMLAAALGQPYHMSFGGRFDLEFVDDLAQAFIKAARVPFEGAEVFNLPGCVVRMRDVVEAIEDVDPTMRGKISFDDVQLPFPEAVESEPILRVLGKITRTTLDEGVSTTIANFKQNIAVGKLSALTIEQEQVAYNTLG